MSGFMYELKKILLCQRGLLYIALVLLLGTVWLSASDSPADSAMEQYKDEYEWYLEKVKGYCSEESALYLEQEAGQIAEAKENQSALLENYYDGKISESEYKKESSDIEKILEHQNGFEVIYQQYLYVCENTENRCFLQTNGWTGLLGKGTLNFILFLGILLLATPAFCSEYSCQMDALLLTSREGRKSALYKLLILIGAVLFLSFGISLMEYGFYRFRYGLPDGDYPIQSIRYFADSSKDISLLQGYVSIGLLRMFGGVFLALLLMFLSVLTKRYAVTLLTGAVSVIVPYVGLSKTSIYRLPLPLPFLLGTDFFAGNIVLRDALKGDEKRVFAEVDTVTLLALLSVSMLLCTLAAAWILRCNSNRWLMKSGRKKRGTLAVMLGLALAVTGCAGREKTGSVVYNSSAVFDCMGYEIIRDAETFDYYLRDASTKETYPLARSPVFGVFSEDEEIRACYVCPPYLYYTTSVMESHVNRVGNYNTNMTKVSVVELNLDTFEEKTIFEQITDSGRSLLGIDYETGDKWQFLDFHYAFFLNDESIFFLGNDGLTQVDRFTGKTLKLDIPVNGNISFDGESIFYKNEREVLTRYSVSEGEIYTYEDIVAYDFCMDEQSIYYVSRTDGGCLYSCGKDGNHKEMISDIPAMAVTCDAGHIYVLARESGEEIVLPKSR